MNKNKIIAGVDYSMTSPAICVGSTENSDFVSSKHFFFYKEKRNKIPELNGLDFNFQPYMDWELDQHRQDNLSEWAIDIMMENDVDEVFIEGYSFNSNIGRVFHIAENGGLLKWKLWKEEIPFDVVPPLTLKKFATDSGRAKKEDMEKVFLKKEGIDIRNMLRLSMSEKSPISDIIDAFYLMKYGVKINAEK